jgi:predicted  nucleic acid-binding Zn-ribbon protein
MEKEKENIIKRYIEKRDIISKYEEEIKKLKEEIQEIGDIILDTFEKAPAVDGYKMSFTSRRLYNEWPDDIQELEEQLKELKAQAKRVGNVSYSITKYITLKKNGVTNKLQNKKPKD